MHNRAIAERFGQIADMLEAKGESIFRINAYRRAARSIEALTEDVVAIADRGGLKNVPGIGGGTAEKIEEFLRTGTMKFYEELAASLPPGLTSLMKVPVVGPKTAMILYEKLHVTSIDELEAAAKSGKIRDLPRMGAKTEENILKGIAMLRRSGARRSLGVVWPVANELVERLRGLEGVQQISVAGSLRRMKENIGDIDILVTSKKPGVVMDAFVSAPGLAQVLSHGPTRSSVVLDVGLQADVRVVEPEAYGAALQYFTGSKDHNVKLRERAIKKGLKLNEYGVWKVDGGERVAGTSEEDVYKAVGVPWIPPELREDLGEIDAALTGRLPDLVTVPQIRGDLHIHTKWSDGSETAEAMAAVAKTLGYEYLCITDHSQSLKMAGGVTIDELRDHIKHVRALSDRAGLALLIGTECDIAPDGSLDYPDDVLAELDLVIASVHTRLKMSREDMTNRVTRAMQSGRVDILGHPTGRRLGQREEYDLDMEAVVDAAVATGTALEVNASPGRLDLSDVHVRLATERGARLAIGSDAHTGGQMHYMPLGVGVARRGWAQSKDVINTRPLRDLLKMLKGAARTSRRRP